MELLTCPVVFGRPYYAEKQKMNCSMCHVSPIGGGPRTIFGKVYGAKNLTNLKTSQTDLYYGDVRFVGYYPTKDTQDKSSGVALMSAAGTLNLPILEQDSNVALRGVFTYDISPNVNAVRDAYFLWNTSASNPLLPKQILFGRFNAPFGLLTDEHRTYTRMQTHTSFRDYEMGVDASGEPLPTLHYDLALTSGFQAGGSFQTGVRYATIANLRWNPASLPFLVGGSFSFHQERSGDRISASAGSVYSVFSFSNLTNNKVPVSVSGEGVLARRWNNKNINPNIQSFFVPANSTDNFLQNVAGSTSLGIFAELAYDVINRLTLLYRFDRLTLDIHYPGDSFMRHGGGLRFWFIGNIFGEVRYEKAFVGRATISDSGVKADQDDILAYLRVWF